jgi:hypothetical protein
MENNNKTEEGTMPVLAFIPCTGVAITPEYQFRDYLPRGIFLYKSRKFFRGMVIVVEVLHNPVTLHPLVSLRMAKRLRSTL